MDSTHWNQSHWQELLQRRRVHRQKTPILLDRSLQKQGGWCLFLHGLRKQKSLKQPNFLHGREPMTIWKCKNFFRQCFLQSAMPHIFTLQKRHPVPEFDGTRKLHFVVRSRWNFGERSPWPHRLTPLANAPLDREELRAREIGVGGGGWEHIWELRVWACVDGASPPHQKQTFCANVRSLIDWDFFPQHPPKKNRCSPTRVCGWDRARCKFEQETSRCV